MNRGYNLFRNANNRLPSSQDEDEDLNKNKGNIKGKKEQASKLPLKPLQPMIKVNSPPATSYRNNPTSSLRE